MRRENVFFHDEIFVEDNLRGHEEELWFVGSFDLSKIFMEDGNLFLFKLIAKFFFFRACKSFDRVSNSCFIDDANIVGSESDKYFFFFHNSFATFCKFVTKRCVALVSLSSLNHLLQESWINDKQCVS